MTMCSPLAGGGIWWPAAPPHRCSKGPKITAIIRMSTMQSVTHGYSSSRCFDQVLTCRGRLRPRLAMPPVTKVKRRRRSHLTDAPWPGLDRRSRRQADRGAGMRPVGAQSGRGAVRGRRMGGMAPIRTPRAVRPHRQSPCAQPARCVPTAVKCRCDTGRSVSTASGAVSRQQSAPRPRLLRPLRADSGRMRAAFLRRLLNLADFHVYPTERGDAECVGLLIGTGTRTTIMREPCVTLTARCERRNR
jgi:hypothetical protein